MGQSKSRISSLVSSGGAIAVAIMVMNLATYGSTLMAAVLLGPRQYGAFAAVSGLLLVVAVVMLGLQTTGARRIAAEPEAVAEIEHALMRVTYRAAWVVSGLCLLATPLIDRTLNLGSWRSAALVAVISWPMTVIGGQGGILQGERRWLALAALYLATGLARLAAMCLLFLRAEETVAVFALALGFVVPALVGAAALRRTAAYRLPHVSGAHSAGDIVREMARNSTALLAFFALSNADLIVGRVVLDEHTSGLYAGGTILAKSLLFLPQFVIVVAFPSMSTEEARRRTLVQSVLAVLALGLVGTAAVWVLNDLALAFIGGTDYAEIQDRLWLFALLGTVLGVIQLLVYSVVARQSSRSAYLIWAALVVLVLVCWRTETAVEMATAVTAVDFLLMVALLGVSWWRLREDRPSPA